jgi:mRNA interferase RelE/StbE
MAKYKVVFKPSVEKDLRSLPQSAVTRVFEHAERLRDEPFPRGSRKLAGAERLYRIRIGDYRMIFSVDQEQRQITIQYVRHRRDAYRRL